MGGRFDRDISDQRRPPAATGEDGGPRLCSDPPTSGWRGEQGRPGPVGIRTLSEPVPVTGFAMNLSPMPRIAPPPFGTETSTPWPRSARSPRTTRVTAPKPDGLLGLTETHKILIGDPPAVGGARSGTPVLRLANRRAVVDELPSPRPLLAMTGGSYIRGSRMSTICGRPRADPTLVIPDLLLGTLLVSATYPRARGVQRSLTILANATASSEHQPNTATRPTAPRCPSESAVVACLRGLEGLAGTGCPPLPSLVMKGSAVRVRASALCDLQGFLREGYSEDR